MKKQILTALATLASVTLITGCTQDSLANATPEQVFTPVKISTAKADSIEELVFFSGQATPIQEIDIYGNYTGDIEAVNFNIGDEVNEGDVLFSFDLSDMQKNVDVLESQVNSAESAVDSASLNVHITSGSQKESQILQMESSLTSAKLSYENALKNYENSTALYEAGYVSQAEYDGIEQGYLQAKVSYETLEQNYNLLINKQLAEGVSLANNQLNQALASRDALTVQYNNALDTLNDLNVASPISGMVATKSVEVGEFYNSAYPAFSVINVDEITITINVPESLISGVELNDKVSATFKTIPDKVFTGQIYEISPVPNNSDLTYPVTIKIINTGHLIKSGMFAEVRLVKEEADGVIVVNRNNLEQNDGQWFAYTVSDSTVSVQEVQIGLDNGVNVEVVEGLDAGQQYITSGREYVVDGEQVTIVESADN